jgi:hypothetical protein
VDRPRAVRQQAAQQADRPERPVVTAAALADQPERPVVQQADQPERLVVAAVAQAVLRVRAGSVSAASAESAVWVVLLAQPAVAAAARAVLQAQAEQRALPAQVARQEQAAPVAP